jgi:hypothetical protein
VERTERDQLDVLPQAQPAEVAAGLPAPPGRPWPGLVLRAQPVLPRLTRWDEIEAVGDIAGNQVGDLLALDGDGRTDLLATDSAIAEEAAPPCTAPSGSTAGSPPPPRPWVVAASTAIPVAPRPADKAGEKVAPRLRAPVDAEPV